jgi:uncharacterized coiled-coil DUF342 family protein
MANRIRGITVEINGDTTKLSKALEGVNKNIRTTQTQLKDVEKLLKLDPSNTELLSQKHKLLADAVTSTKEKLDTLKTAAEQANNALANGDITQEQYDALQREIIKTENELRNLQNEADKPHGTHSALCLPLYLREFLPILRIFSLTYRVSFSVYWIFSWGCSQVTGSRCGMVSKAFSLLSGICL